jgi:monoamine oxidase
MKRPKSNLLNRLMKSLNYEIKQQKLAHSFDSRSASRRRFIATTAKGAIGAGLSLSLPTLLNSCGDVGNENGEVLDVAILGGGISGLNCANYLLNSSLSFKVFEGSKRLGGRILTHYNDSLGLGIFPEFGGDFVDSNHEDMLNLAKEFNIEIIDLEKEQQDKKLAKDLYYFDNRLISEKEIIEEFKKVASVISSDAESLGENYDTPDAVKFDNTPLSEYIDSLNCKPWLKEILSAALVAEFGLDCAEQSTINLLDLVDTDTSEGFKVFGESDERYRLKGGNSKIIEGLAKKIGDDKILKNYKVTEITENEKGLYEIVFSNARKVIAKQVVCTIPFTILRTIKLNLKNISADKRKCIDELGYGMNTKLALGYKGTPWSEKPNSAMGYIFHKTISNGWDSSYNKTENNEHGCYICYFGGSVSLGLNDKSFKNKFAPPSHVWRTELPEEEVDSLVTQLDTIFKNSKANFLGKHVFVNWIDYPYSKGSYSCYKKGQWTSISGKEMEPIGNFYFAGEHCSEKFQGFMNGGAETGRHVAEIIRKQVKV